MTQGEKLMMVGVIVAASWIGVFIGELNGYGRGKRWTDHWYADPVPFEVPPKVDPLLQKD